MSELDQNIPDDLWRKAFEDAAETPPPHVWDAIERRLDEDEGTKLLPLWGTGLASSRPFAWVAGLAAAVALLLVGWWALRTAPPEQPLDINKPLTQTRQRSVGVVSDRSSPVASAPLQKQAKHVAAMHPPTSTSCWPSWKNLPKRPVPSAQQQLSEAIAQNQASPSAQNNAVQAAVEPVFAAPDSPALLSQPDARLSAQSNPALVVAMPDPVLTAPVADKQPAQLAQRVLVVSTFRNDVPKNNEITLTVNPGAVTRVANPQLPSPDVLVLPVHPAATAPVLFFNPLHPLTLRLRQPRAIQRIVWVRPNESITKEVAAAQPKRAARAVWASVSMMPGSFNPSVAVRSAPSSYATATSLSNTVVSQPSVRSQANFSVAYQAGAGIQLTDRWSVESGVGYLAGRSTVESPVQASVVSLQSANAGTLLQSANLYVDALRNSVVTTSSVANSLASFDYAGTGSRYSVQNNYNPQTRQSLTNDYQFVQVPVQVGYQLRPRKRLGLALLGGFLSNIFVRNTVGDELVITSKEGVYRPVSWAASIGARFRYRPSRQWSASLAGLYQPSLGFGTKPTSAVQTRPTSTGISFGIDYHF